MKLNLTDQGQVVKTTQQVENLIASKLLNAEAKESKVDIIR